MNTGEASDIVVREAAADDAELLAALMAEMDDEPELVLDGAQMRAVMADMAAYPDFRTYLVLDRTGTAVGTFSLMIFSSPSHHGARQALLDAVVVSRTRRGQGVGGDMLRHAMHIAAASGCYKMTLSSNLKRVDAHRFYEDLGFRQHGISFSILLVAEKS
jgi:GNAT superfamily N-acetyltransferase